MITLRDFPCVNKHAKLILRHYHAKESESYFCDCVYSDQKYHDRSQRHECQCSREDREAILSNKNIVLKNYEILNLHKVNCDFPMVW